MSVNAATAASRSSNASTRLPVLSKIEYVIVYWRVSAGLPAYVPADGGLQHHWISPHRPVERSARLGGADAEAWNQAQLGDMVADAAAGPVDQRPAWLGGLEHRNGHVDDRRPDLRSSWRPLKLVVERKPAHSQGLPDRAERSEPLSGVLDGEL